MGIFDIVALQCVILFLFLMYRPMFEIFSQADLANTVVHVLLAILVEACADFFGFLKHDLIFELFQLLFVQKVLCVKCLFWQCHRISTEIFVFQFSVDFFYLFGSFSNFFCAPRYFTFVSCRIEQYLRKVFLETLFGSIRMSFWRVGWILIPSHIFYVFCEAPFLSCVVRFEFGVLQPF